MTSSSESPHVLYRFYSRTHQLLYVGITANPPQRFRSHQGKDWWSEARLIEMDDEFNSREELAEAERRAIREERPLYNVVYNEGTVFYRPARTINPIEYRCGACGQIISKDTGYVHVRSRDIARAKEARQDFNNAWHAHPVSEHGVRIVRDSALPRIKPARWLVHHEECDPDVDANRYRIEVERANTHERLVSWTAHLMSKAWLQHTDWAVFLRSTLSPQAQRV
jgi:predicted GIY-YIG superfamily endonuclease